MFCTKKLVVFSMFCFFLTGSIWGSKIVEKKDITPELLKDWKQKLKGVNLVIEAMGKERPEMRQILDSLLFNIDDSIPRYSFLSDVDLDEKRGVNGLIHHEICYDFCASKIVQQIASGLADWFVANKNYSDIGLIFKRFARLFLCIRGGSTSLDDNLILDLIIAIYDRDKALAKKLFAILDDGDKEDRVKYTKNRFYSHVLTFNLVPHYMGSRKGEIDLTEAIKADLRKFNDICGAVFFNNCWAVIKDEEFSNVVWAQAFGMAFQELRDRRTNIVFTAITTMLGGIWGWITRPNPVCYGGSSLGLGIIGYCGTDLRKID